MVHRIDVAGSCGEHQRSLSILVCLVDIHVARQKRAHDSVMAWLSCARQRSPPTMVCLEVDVFVAHRQQNLHYSEMALLTREQKRRPPVLVCLVDVRVALRQKDSHHLVMAALSCNHQRSLFANWSRLVDLNTDLCALRQEDLHHFAVAVTSCEHQRSPAALVCLVDIRAALRQLLKS